MIPETLKAMEIFPLITAPSQSTGATLREHREKIRANRPEMKKKKI